MTLKKKIEFYRKFAALINSGISIESSLENLLKLKPDKNTVKMITILYHGLKRGISLNDIMQKNSDYFTDFESEIIGIGEKSGNLDQNQLFLAEYFESVNRFKTKLISGFMLPFFYLHGFVVVVFFLDLFFMPGYSTGQFIIDMVKAIIVIDVLPYTVYRIVKSKKVNFAVGNFISGVPVIGSVLLKISIYKLIIGWKCLYSAGIHMASSIETAAKVSGNIRLKNECLGIAAATRQGKTLQESIAHSKVFPPMVISMLSTGEQSGRMDQVFDKIAEYYKDEIEQSLALFVKIIPIIFYVLSAFYMASRIIGSYHGSITDMNRL